MPVIGDLPMACAATCSVSARVQEMGVEAAVHGDVTLLKQAMLHDPADRRGLQSRGSLADDRRNAGRPGEVACLSTSPRFPPPAGVSVTTSRNGTRVKLRENVEGLGPQEDQGH